MSNIALIVWFVFNLFAFSAQVHMAPIDNKAMHYAMLILEPEGITFQLY